VLRRSEVGVVNSKARQGKTRKRKGEGIPTIRMASKEIMQTFKPGLSKVSKTTGRRAGVV
jgi:hypothetical protein